LITSINFRGVTIETIEKIIIMLTSSTGSRKGSKAIKRNARNPLGELATQSPKAKQSSKKSLEEIDWLMMESSKRLHEIDWQTIPKVESHNKHITLATNAARTKSGTKIGKPVLDPQTAQKSLDTKSIATSGRPPSGSKSTSGSKSGNTANKEALATLSAKTAPSVAASTVSDLHHPLFFEAGESEFELMHVKVTVLGLTGILSEKNPEKKLPSTTPKASGPSSKLLSSNGGSVCEESTLTSVDLNSDDANAFTNKDGTPTTAVLSYQRNVSNSETTIVSHLPSMPLGMPTSSFGFVNRYMASWPAETAIPFLHGDDVIEQSTFTLLRVMMRQPYTSGDTRASTNISTYVQDTIDLKINLARGRELIPLGVATLVISGDEDAPVVVNVPAKSVRVKNGKATVVGASSKKKSRAPKIFRKVPALPCFVSDPSRKFNLDENATLRVSIQTIPHGTLKAAEASRARREIMIRKELNRMQDESSVAVESKTSRRARREAILEELSKLGPPTPTNIPLFGQLKSQLQSQSLKSSLGLFCGSQLCMAQVKEEVEPFDEKELKMIKKAMDYTVDTRTIDNYLKDQLGMSYASSSEDLSSVSGSESSSQSESEEEDVQRHLNRKITIRHR
jgi:hypothetical protein